MIIKYLCLLTSLFKSVFLTYYHQIGETKVFLGAGKMAELDSQRAEALSHSAKVIQRHIRRYMARKEYNTLRKSSIHVQSIWRGLQQYITMLFLSRMYLVSWSHGNTPLTIVFKY